MKDPKMTPPPYKQTYTANDFESLGFHDCYMHAIRWDTPKHSFIIELDYIMEWVRVDQSFQFWIAAAELTFEDSLDIQMAIDWIGEQMLCEIEGFYKRDRKSAPDGSDLFLWDLQLARPTGAIQVWAADFRLEIQGPPILSSVQNLR